MHNMGNDVKGITEISKVVVLHFKMITPSLSPWR
jgi:hypothetical protein